MRRLQNAKKVRDIQYRVVIKREFFQHLKVNSRLKKAKKYKTYICFSIHAINKDGNVDEWQCAVYYNGANGSKNPFMPPEAFANFDNRLEIIAGEAKVTPETAKKILDKMKLEILKLA